MVSSFNKNCQSLEVEAISLRTDIERVETKKGLNEKLTEGSRKIDKIINSQRYSGKKIGLGYSRTNEYSMGKTNFRSIDICKESSRKNQ